jgi:hypothetical protein
MKVSKFLIASLIFSTSILGVNLKGHAAEPESPSSIPMGTTAAPVGGGTPEAPASTPDVPTSTPTTPSTPAETPTSAPSSVSPPAESASVKTASTVVLATCGHSSATYVFNNAESVTVGCRLSTINKPPAAAM